MGIWDKLSGQARAQFLDVIQSLEGDGGTLLRRFPIYDQAITDQSKLIVREGQVAVFLSGGKLSEVFGPGTYTLDTPNSPIWSFFHTLGYGLENPYKGDVLFVSTTQHTDNGWGTQNPFMMRDAEFGPVRLRAFGSFSFRVKDAAVFVRELVGTDGHFTVDEVVGQLKKRVVVAFTTAVARLGVPVLDMAAHQAELGDRIRDVMGPELEAAYGIGLTDFTVANISLPEEVEKALDTRSRMGVLGDLGAYTRLQAADAIGDAARNPGVGGMGASLGVGVGVGQVMAGALGQAMAPSVGAPGAPQAATPPLPDDRFHYAGPQGQQQAEAPAIAASVRAAPDARHLVWRKGWSGWKPAKEVPEIAALLTSDEPPPLPDDDGPPPLP